jgi:hypothetical protein
MCSIEHGGYKISLMARNHVIAHDEMSVDQAVKKMIGPLNRGR